MYKCMYVVKGNKAHELQKKYATLHPVFFKFSPVKELNPAVQIGCVDVDMIRQREAHHVTAKGNRESMSAVNRSIDC